MNGEEEKLAPEDHENREAKEEEKPGSGEDGSASDDEKSVISEVEESALDDPDEFDSDEEGLNPDDEMDGEAGPGLSKTQDASEDTPREVLLSRIESLVFVSPEPISVRRLARFISIPGKLVRELLGELEEHYKDRGIILQEVSQGFQFRSHPDNAPVIRNIFKMRPMKISRPALETLAIVAYRQPLTRAEAESIRGVDCGGVLKYLFEKGLVRVIGRKEEPGRPIIYGTSQAFLELFGLKSLGDLPALHEFSELWDEHQEIVDSETPAEDEPQTWERASAPTEKEAEAAAAEPGEEAAEPGEEAAEPVEGTGGGDEEPAEFDEEPAEFDEDADGDDGDFDEGDEGGDAPDVDEEENAKEFLDEFSDEDEEELLDEDEDFESDREEDEDSD